MKSATARKTAATRATRIDSPPRPRIARPQSSAGSTPVPRRGATASDSSSERFDPHVAGIDYGPLDGLIGYAIRRAQLVIYEDFMQALAPWDLSPQRYSALTIIARNSGLKQTELGRILGIARSGVVMVTNSLEELGYVERADSTHDKRAFALKLTRRGAQALNRIEQAVREHDDRISAQLTAKEKAGLLELLGKLGPPVAHEEPAAHSTR